MKAIMMIASPEEQYFDKEQKTNKIRSSFISPEIEVRVALLSFLCCYIFGMAGTILERFF